MILASRFLHTHLVRLIVSNLPLPDKIDQSYINNIIRHVSRLNNNKADKAKNNDPTMIVTASLINFKINNIDNLPIRNNRISVCHAEQYSVNINTHLKHNWTGYTLKYLMFKLREAITGIEDKLINNKVIRRSCWRIIYHVCWNKDFDFNPPNSISNIVDRISDDFVLFYDEFDKNEDGRMSTGEAIRYFYWLIRETGGVHTMKLVPQSSLTVKSITIDETVCKTIRSKIEKKKNEKKKKKVRKNKKKNVKNKPMKYLNKSDSFKSIFQFNEPKNYQLSLIRTDGVAIDFIFQDPNNKTSKYKRKRTNQEEDDSDRSLKQQRVDGNDDSDMEIEAIETAIDVSASNTNMKVNNTNVKVNNTNVRVNHRYRNRRNRRAIIGVDLGRKDLFTSANHPNRDLCNAKGWSNRQWQFESGLSIWNKQLRKWKNKNINILIFEAALGNDTAIQSLTLAQSTRHLQYVHDKLPVVVEFYFKRRHCRHVFWLCNRRQKAFNKMCHDIGKGANIIAIGNPTFDPSSRFHAPTPTKAVIKALCPKYPTKVQLIDEYNTSRLCSKCHQELTYTNMKTKSKKQNVRVQYCRRCNQYWNRDVNAALNMRALYVYQRDNDGAQMPAFKRPVSG